MAALNSLKKFTGSLSNGVKGRRGMAATAGTFHEHQAAQRVAGKGGLFLPKYGPMWVVIGILGGFTAVAGLIGIHTASQQLRNSPSVMVTKRKRKSVPEVDIPDVMLGSSDKMLNSSFLRKVGHIQNAHNDSQTPDIFTRSRDIESLHSVGIRT